MAKKISTFVQNKFDALKSQIKPGDGLLIEGTGFLSNAIKWSDSSKFSHVALVSEMYGRPMLVQAMADGVVPFFLEQELIGIKDFAIVKINLPQEVKDIKLKQTLSELECTTIPYNDWELPRILLAEKLGFKFKDIQGNPHDEICSVFFCVNYGGKYPIPAWQEAYKKRGFITPDDILRNPDPIITIIGNDSL